MHNRLPRSGCVCGHVTCLNFGKSLIMSLKPCKICQHMIQNEQVVCNFNCLFENEGLLKVMIVVKSRN